MKSDFPKLSWSRLIGLAREISHSDVVIALDENRYLLAVAKRRRDEVSKLRDAALKKLKNDEWKTLSDDSATTARLRQTLAEQLAGYSADVLRFAREVTTFSTIETALELLAREISAGPRWTGFDAGGI